MQHAIVQAFLKKIGTHMVFCFVYGLFYAICCNQYTYLQYDSKMISSEKLSYPIDEANVLAKPDFTICHCLIVEKITISS